MVLAPHVARQQVGERRHRTAPGDVARRLEPLGVLVEHGVDDVDEGLVAVEEPVATGQEVPLEPALAEVLGEHLHDPPVRGEVVVSLDGLGHPRPVGDLEDVLEAVRGRLVGTEETEVRGVVPDHVPQERSEHPGRLAQRGARRLRPPRRSRSSRGARGRASSTPPLACGDGAHATLPDGGQCRDLGHGTCRPRRRARRAGSCASTPRAGPGGPGWSGPLRAAPDGPATSPRQRMPSTNFGPVQPLGVRRMIMGHAGRSRTAPERASAQMVAISSKQASRATAIRWCTSMGSSSVEAALAPRRPVAVPREQRRQLVVGDPGQHRGIGDLVAVEVEDGQHRTVGDGVEELVGVPARRRRRRSRPPRRPRHRPRRGQGCRRPPRRRGASPYPSSPPSLIEPGVSGAAWLGIPPGNENCRNSRAMPLASLDTWEYSSL